MTERRPDDPLDQRLVAHDLDIWIGAEPTFTRRDSTDPWWLWQADPDVPEAVDKRTRAAAVAAVLARLLGGTVHRVVGRHYPDEPAPRP